jgi:hypothetical protein
MSVDQLFKGLPDAKVVDVNGLPYAFQDNGSNVLAVAHCDTVEEEFHRTPLRAAVLGLEDVFMTTPSLDDRLGVHVLLDVLPQLGIHPDILLTTNEEHGASTAAVFKSEKQYNWIFSFDRRGLDVVTYCYGWPHGHLQEFFQEIGTGTYSDISRLEHLSCQGLNIGVGYHNEHSARCFARWSDTSSQVLRFQGFWNKYKDQAFPYVARERWSYGWGGHGGYQTLRHEGYEIDDDWEDATEDPLSGSIGATSAPGTTTMTSRTGCGITTGSNRITQTSRWGNSTRSMMSSNERQS